MQRLKQWELKRAIYEKKALAKPETAKQGPNCIVSQMEVSLIYVWLVSSAYSLMVPAFFVPVAIFSPKLCTFVTSL